jgi:uncharacterized membrane protein
MNLISKLRSIKTIPIGLIIVLALVLRLISLNQSFWLDEAINVIAARDRGLSSLLLAYSIGDFHPPLFHAILWSWFKLFPATEIFARLPSVILGAATVFLTYQIAKLIFSHHKKSPPLLKGKLGKSLSPEIIVSLLVASSGLHIYYSQEARMYSLAAFTNTLVFFSLLKLKKRNSIKNKALYLGSLILMLLSDYQPWLLLPLFFMLLPGLTSLATLLTIPWWPTLSRQVEIGMATASAFPAWGAVVGRLTIKSALLVPVKFLIGRVSIDNNALYTAVIFIPLLVAGAGILKFIKIKEPKTRVLKGWLLLPFIIGALVSIKIPIFSYFRFLFVLPAFYLALIFGLWKYSRQIRSIAITILLLTNLVSSTAYLTMTRFHREDWRGLVDYLNQFDNSKTLVIFPNLAQAAGFDYYNRERLKTQDVQNLNVREEDADIFLVKYVSEIFDPKDLLAQHLNGLGYQLESENNFRGIPLWHYSLKMGNYENSN